MGPDPASRPIPSAREAERFIADSEFIWHQEFELVPGVVTPGVSSVAQLAELAALPNDLRGQRVLDVGTSNGGTALECERRGAARVVAVDVLGPEVHGIEQVLKFVHSDVEYVQASVYELDRVLEETFDLIVFWGVLYHLRHPLLALDTLRMLCTGTLSVETAVADAELGPAAVPAVRFYRRAELGDDPSNWFAPTTRVLGEWLQSSGFAPTRMEAWPADEPSRAMVNATVVTGVPEYVAISYERPLQVTTLGAPDGVAG
jgi:tRNA (mo5U34)-methyltransferase